MHEKSPDALGTRVSKEEKLEDFGPGAYRYWAKAGEKTPGGLHFNCPCGCRVVYGVNFERNKWNSNLERPTLVGTIACQLVKPGQSLGLDGWHWRGKLVQGTFIGTI